MRTVCFLLLVAGAAAAHLRVDPVQTAGDKGMTSAQKNESVADVSKKPMDMPQGDALNRPTTLTTEVSLPAGVSQNAELKSVVSNVVSTAVKNYQAIVSKGRKAGPFDIIGTAGATGTFGGPNSIAVSPVVGPEPVTEMAKKLKQVQEEQAIIDISFAKHVAESMQSIEKQKKQCEADYNAAKKRLKDEQAEREMNKRFAIGKVTGEGEYGEMMRSMDEARKNAEDAKRRLLAIIKRLQDEFAIAQETGQGKFAKFIDEATGKIEAEKADWEKKKAEALEADAKAEPVIQQALKARLDTMASKKQVAWDGELQKFEDKKTEFNEKWAAKKKELEARVAVLKEKIKQIDDNLKAFLDGIQSKMAKRTRNRDKDARNVLAGEKGEKKEEMEDEGSVNAPDDADSAVKKAMVDSEKQAQITNAQSGHKLGHKNTTKPVAAEKPKPCVDATSNKWLCEKAKAMKCADPNSAILCAKTCGKCGAAAPASF
jgi:hypothetical protein